MDSNSLEKCWKNFTPGNICNYKWKYSLNIVQFNCSLDNRPWHSGYCKERVDPAMELTAMCFCLLPVTGSNLNFLLPREVCLCDFGHFRKFVDILCLQINLFQKWLVVCLLQVNRDSRFSLLDPRMKYQVGGEILGCVFMTVSNIYTILNINSSN